MKLRDACALLPAGTGPCRAALALDLTINHAEGQENQSKSLCGAAGKEVSMKDVTEKVAELNVQLQNLCSVSGPFLVGQLLQWKHA